MDEQQLQQQIIQLVQAAMQGNQLATQQIQQIMLAAQQGDQLAVLIAQMIQQVALQMQQLQVRAAKFGAKLNYIKLLGGVCPEGYEMQYFKQGGQLCKKCMKVLLSGGEFKQTPNTVAGQFKTSRKKRPIEEDNSNRNVINGSVTSGKAKFDPSKTQLPSRKADGAHTPSKLKKADGGSNNIFIPRKENGGNVEMDKCGRKMKKKACGGNLKKKN